MLTHENLVGLRTSSASEAGIVGEVWFSATLLAASSLVWQCVPGSGILTGSDMFLAEAFTVTHIKVAS